MIATLPPTRRATPDDLMKVEGKAELINGGIVHLMASGDIPGGIAFYIARKLADYAEEHDFGIVHTDGIACVVPELSSGRESFIPDAAYYHRNRRNRTMKFMQGAPEFAVEVRSENDYGRTAERDLAAKRADYFEAGTKVVWDVDPEEKVVRVYRADQPETAEVYGDGQEANAEPALPGWKLPVARIFA
jgi:Uma2 family endonuclease